MYCLAHGVYSVLGLNIQNYTFYTYCLVCMLCSVALLCSTLWDPMDLAHQARVHGIFQARILEWAAISYSRGSSWPRGRTHITCVSCIGLGSPLSSLIVSKMKMIMPTTQGTYEVYDGIFEMLITQLLLLLLLSHFSRVWLWATP